METLTLKRTYQRSQTLGVLTGKGIKLVTMELRWFNNMPQHSCIPEGKYVVLPRTSPKYGKHFHIQDVPNRDLILVHNCNYSHELLGCIGVGKDFADINKDGIMDISASKLALAELVKKFPKGFEIVISV